MRPTVMLSIACVLAAMTTTLLPACTGRESAEGEGEGEEGEGEGEGEGGVAGDPCSSDEPCAANHVCTAVVDGACIQRCADDSECNGASCVPSLNLEDACTGEFVGAPCVEDATCGELLLCGFPFGTLAEPGECVVGGVRGESCGTVTDGGSSFFPCVEGLSCLPIPGSGSDKSVPRSCEIACDGDDDCAATESCILGRCIDDPCRAGCPVEAAGCAQSSSCERRCVVPAQLGEACLEAEEASSCDLFTECLCAVTTSCDVGLVCDDVSGTCVAE